MGMRRILALAITVFAIAFGGFAYIVAGKTSEPGPPRKAVVVELFTSEGCSSCPPADELLAHLRQDLSAKNIQVIPLGFHVDYWNSLGWKDRFSSAEYSRRQEQYTQSLRVDGPYTPEMVIDGTTELVGNDRAGVHTAITEAAAHPAAVDIRISTRAPGRLDVQVSNNWAVNGVVRMVITEDNLTTKVGAGENNGRELYHDAVVRRLQRLADLQRGSFMGSISLHIEKEWKPENLRVVVFVQEGDAGKIFGAASVPLNVQTR